MLSFQTKLATELCSIANSGEENLVVEEEAMSDEEEALLLSSWISEMIFSTWHDQGVVLTEKQLAMHHQKKRAAARRRRAARPDAALSPATFGCVALKMSSQNG